MLRTKAQVNVLRVNKFTFVALISIIVFFIESLRLDMFQLSLKPYVLISLAFILYLAGKTIYFPKLAWLLVMWWLFIPVAYFTGGFISNSDTAAVFFGQLLLLLILGGTYTLLIKFNNKYNSVQEGIHIAFIVVLYSATLVGVLQIIGYYGFHSTLGIFHPEHMGFPRAKSYFSEPDWYGFSLGLSFLYIFSMKHFSKYYYTNLFVAFIGLLSSGTRASFFGVFIVVLLYSLINGGFYKKIKKLMLFIIGGVFAVTLLLFIMPDRMIERFNPSTATSQDGGAFDSRLFTMTMTIDHIMERPWFGNGAGGLGELSKDEDNKRLYASGGDLNTGRGGSNLFLTSLFDVGIIGTIPLLLFVLIMMVKAIKVIIKVDIRNLVDANLLSYTLMLVFIFIEVMINNIIRHALIWVIIGIFFYLLKIFENRSSKVLE